MAVGIFKLPKLNTGVDSPHPLQNFPHTIPMTYANPDGIGAVIFDVKTSVWSQFGRSGGDYFVATIRKHRGKWQATIRRKGAKTVTRSFTTKGAAATFARKIEHAMDVVRNPDDVSTLSKLPSGN